MSSPIHQEVDFESAPQKIFDALTDAKQFASWTDAPAELGANAGDAFSLFGGHIVGRNVELIPGKRVIQAWRAAEWEDGIYSIVRFELEPVDSGTRLVFDQAGFPEAAGPHLEGGWKKMYWEPVRKFVD